MKFSSIKDVLSFAVSKERASVQFYRDVSSQMNSSATKALFEALVKKEVEHVQSLVLEIQKLGYTVSNETEQGSDFEWDERLDIDDTARNMDFLEALVLAIQKERAAFRLYAQLIGSTGNEEFDTILLELAEEEMRHVLQLEREYEIITQHKG